MLSFHSDIDCDVEYEKFTLKLFNFGKIFSHVRHRVMKTERENIFLENFMQQNIFQARVKLLNAIESAVKINKYSSKLRTNKKNIQNS